MRWEKTAVYDIEIMHFVGTTVQIQHRSRRVFSKPTGTALMSNNLYGHITARMGCKDYLYLLIDKEIRLSLLIE
jgi:hypothetical protein